MPDLVTVEDVRVFASVVVPSAVLPEDDELIQGEIDKRNQSTYLQVEKAKYRTEIWDKVTTINLKTAAEVLARPDIAAVLEADPNGAIYLVIRVSDGYVLNVQAYDDKATSSYEPLTPTLAALRAEQRLSLLAQRDAIARILQEVVDAVNRIRFPSVATVDAEGANPIVVDGSDHLIVPRVAKTEATTTTTTTIG